MNEMNYVPFNLIENTISMIRKLLVIQRNL